MAWANEVACQVDAVTVGASAAKTRLGTNAVAAAMTENDRRSFMLDSFGAELCHSARPLSIWCNLRPPMADHRFGSQSPLTGVLPKCRSASGLRSQRVRSTLVTSNQARLLPFPNCCDRGADRVPAFRQHLRFRGSTRDQIINRLGRELEFRRASCRTLRIAVEIERLNSPRVVTFEPHRAL